MSSHMLAQRRHKLELLNRMLDKTSLTTKKVTHGHIVDLGELIQKKYNVDVDGEKQRAVEEALKEAEKRHSRELRAALKRLENDLVEDKHHALDKQQRYYELKARRVAEQRDEAEEERIRELRKKWDGELKTALALQWQECERLKAVAIDEACTLLTKKLRNEHALDRERCVAEALAKARESFRIREAQSIARTKLECEERFELERSTMKRQHREEIHRHLNRYKSLELMYKNEMEHKIRVQQDFKALQDDYKRFMDYSDGHYHSDYLMHLRSHGAKGVSNRGSRVVKYTEINEL